VKRYFTKTFYRFFFGFLVILGVAFGVMALSASVIPSPVDTVAHPQ
jgi:hypothetical protein